MKKILYSGILFVLYYIFASCTNDINKRVDWALNFAGPNSLALDSVLSHYEGNPLKQEAARFLIANLPYYYSYTSPLIDSLKNLKKKFIKRQYYTEEELKKWKSFNYKQSPKVYDARVVKADLLIDNIDLVFAAWEKRPWNKHYSFAEFCEYILPYRVGDEPLEQWRKIYYERYNPILDSLYQGTDVMGAAECMIAYIQKEWFYNDRTFSYPNLGAMFLLENRLGYCRDACDVVSYVMRAVGIPVAVDLYVISPCYSSQHSWNAIVDTTGRVIPVNYSDRKKVTRTKHDTRRRGKVYRTCFGVQPEKIKDIYGNKDIPSLFRNPFLRDVTNEYFPENEIELEISDTDAKYVYLSIYNEKEYIPIDIAIVQRGKALFRNLEDSLVYYPTARCEGIMEPIDYPFLLKNGQQQYFIPDSVRQIEIKLKRKYPLISYHLKNVVGVSFEGMNKTNSKKVELLYKIDSVPETNYNSVILNKTQYYRYIRCQPPKSAGFEMADIMFYGNEKQWYPVDVFSEQRRDRIYEQKLWNIFDNNWVSYYLSMKKDESIICDLGKKRPIDKIVYIPRNDDNYIHLGDIYELYYHNGNNDWKFVERKQADTTFISFKNIPDDAMLLLRNTTRGKEERAFYYKDGKQIFP